MAKKKTKADRLIRARTYAEDVLDETGLTEGVAWSTIAGGHIEEVDKGFWVDVSIWVPKENVDG